MGADDRSHFELAAQADGGGRAASGPLRVLLLIDLAREELDGLPGESIDPLVGVACRLNPLRFSPRLGVWRELVDEHRYLGGQLPTHDRLGPDRRAWWGWRQLTALRRLAALFHAEADIVLLAGPPPLRFWGTCAALLTRRPLVVVDPLRCLANREQGPGWSDRWVLRRATALIASTRGAYEELLRRRGPVRDTAGDTVRDTVHWIATGVDTERFDFQADGPFRVRRSFGLEADVPLVGVAGMGGEPTWRVAELLNCLLGMHATLRVVLMARREAYEHVRPLLGAGFAARVLPVDGEDRAMTRAQLLAALQALCWFANPDEDDLLLRQTLACRVPAVLLEPAANRGTPSRRTGIDDAGCWVAGGGGDRVGCGRPMVEEAARQAVELLGHPALAAERGQAGREAIVRDGGMGEMVRRYERVLGELFSRPGGSSALPDLPGAGTLEICPAT